jgi:ABC-type uncharacterized transport system involved in gliding motility auxiliary subunit
MNPKYRKYAVIGLYVALAAGIAALGLYIVYKQFNLGVQAALGFIVIGLAFSTIMNPQRVREIFKGRQIKYGSNALIMGLAILGILVVVNILVNGHNKTWDLTQDQENTLTQETVDMLKALPEKVTARAFYSSAPADTARSLLERYKSVSGGKFDYKFIDPVKDPVAAQQANITTDGTVVLQMGDRQEPVSVLTEEQIDIALVKLINPQSRSVYFLTGHGEHDITASDQENGLSSLKTMLESKNYTVASLSLLSTNKIPDDASVIIIDGARKPLSQAEVDLLKAFLAKGKALIVLQDSVAQTSFGDTPDPLAEYFATAWGLVMNKDVVVDLSSPQPNIAIGDSSSYGSSPITRNMNNLDTVFPVARSISATPVQGITQVELVSTTYNSWGEVTLNDLETTGVKYDEGLDFKGPLALAYTAENTANGSRLILIGDTDFTINGYLSYNGNSNLITNSVDWTTGQENLINLTPRTSTNRVVISPKAYSMRLIFLMVILVIPGIILLAGILVWAQRKKRG